MEKRQPSNRARIFDRHSKLLLNPYDAEKFIQIVTQGKNEEEADEILERAQKYFFGDKRLNLLLAKNRPR